MIITLGKLKFENRSHPRILLHSTFWPCYIGWVNGFLGKSRSDPTHDWKLLEFFPWRKTYKKHSVVVYPKLMHTPWTILFAKIHTSILRSPETKRDNQNFFVRKESSSTLESQPIISRCNPACPMGNIPLTPLAFMPEEYKDWTTGKRCGRRTQQS